jgi:hypothetical protein
MTDAGQSASSSADAAGTRKGLGNPVIVERKAAWRRRDCGDGHAGWSTRSASNSLKKESEFPYVCRRRDIWVGIELAGLEMGFDRRRLMEIFEALGDTLAKPTTAICVIGSSPGIASGQPERQTPDIDVLAPEIEL